jgi:hypothetical protein
VDERLGFVKVVQQKDGSSNETKQDSEVVGDQIVSDDGGHVFVADEFPWYVGVDCVYLEVK